MVWPRTIYRTVRYQCSSLSDSVECDRAADEYIRDDDVRWCCYRRRDGGAHSRSRYCNVSYLILLNSSRACASFFIYESCNLKPREPPVPGKGLRALPNERVNRNLSIGDSRESPPREFSWVRDDGDRRTIPIGLNSDTIYFVLLLCTFTTTRRKIWPDTEFTSVSIPAGSPRSVFLREENTLHSERRNVLKPLNLVIYFIYLTITPTIFSLFLWRFLSSSRLKGRKFILQV